MNAKHIEGGLTLVNPFQGARSVTYIPITCYTQNPGCSSVSQNIPLANAWESQNVDGFLIIIGPFFHMLTNHMCSINSLNCPSCQLVKYTNLHTQPIMLYCEPD